MKCEKAHAYQNLRDVWHRCFSDKLPLPACRIDTSLEFLQVKTDLQKQWYVLWMDGNTVRRQNLQHNGAAVHVVELALGVRQTTREGEKAFVNRQRTPDNNIPQPRNVKCEGLPNPAVDMPQRTPCSTTWEPIPLPAHSVMTSRAGHVC